MRRRLCSGFAGALLTFVAVGSVRAEENATQEVRVIGDKAFVYEGPSRDAFVLRRAYVGELLMTDHVVDAPDGSRWYAVKLGEERRGYVSASQVGHPLSPMPQRPWVRNAVVRDARPLGIGLRALGETHGGALTVRYQAFSRLGTTFGGGSVIDKNKMRGTSLSAGLYSTFVLYNLSPIIEAGFARTSYHAGLSKLELTNFYLMAGIEWMFDFGFFANAFVTFIRSADVEVAYEYTDAQRGDMTVGNFGKLDLGDEPSFQSLQPGLTIGYAF